MTRALSIKTLAVLFAALFLFAQGMASAHVVEFGTDHDHDGVACSVSVLCEDQTLVPAPIETVTIPVIETPAIRLSPTKSVIVTTAHLARAPPPPRAPPH